MKHSKQCLVTHSIKRIKRQESILKKLQELDPEEPYTFRGWNEAKKSIKHHIQKLEQLGVTRF